MKQEEQSPNNNSKRMLNVIVLTDNRDSPNTDKNNTTQTADKSHIDFRSSAFKETQVDPLQFPKTQFNHIRDEQLLAQLNKRITDLQSRVHALQQKEGMKQHSSNSPQKVRKHKIRRRNIQMNKDRQCIHCGKNYGTETALKYHVKLKHQEKNKKQGEK